MPRRKKRIDPVTKNKLEAIASEMATLNPSPPRDRPIFRMTADSMWREYSRYTNFAPNYIAPMIMRSV